MSLFTMQRSVKDTILLDPILIRAEYQIQPLLFEPEYTAEEMQRRECAAECGRETPTGGAFV